MLQRSPSKVFFLLAVSGVTLACVMWCDRLSGVPTEAPTNAAQNNSPPVVLSEATLHPSVAPQAVETQPTIEDDDDWVELERWVEDSVQTMRILNNYWASSQQYPEPERTPTNARHVYEHLYLPLPNDDWRRPWILRIMVRLSWPTYREIGEQDESLFRIPFQEFIGAGVFDNYGGIFNRAAYLQALCESSLFHSLMETQLYNTEPLHFNDYHFAGYVAVNYGQERLRVCDLVAACLAGDGLIAHDAIARAELLTQARLAADCNPFTTRLTPGR